MQSLEQLIVRSAVSDDFAAELWFDSFGAADPVPWSQFLVRCRSLSASASHPSDAQPAFLLALKMPPNMVTALCDEQSREHQQLPATARITVQCLRRYLCGPVLGGGASRHSRDDARHSALARTNSGGALAADDDACDVVWLERYGASMDVFRPLPGARHNEAALLDELAALCATGWFHGHATRGDAHARLQQADAGTFLVRCSASSGVGHWAISFVRAGADGANTIVHRRIRHTLAGFELESNTTPPGLTTTDDDDALLLARAASPDTAAATAREVGQHTLITSLVHAAAAPLGLSSPSRGSPFETLFLPSATEDSVR